MSEFVKSIQIELKEKNEILRAKIEEQPLTKIYSWIQRNAKIILYEVMIESVPEPKRIESVVNWIHLFIEELEKTTFDSYFVREYSRYAYKMRSYSIHGSEICRILFNESVSKAGNVPNFLKHFCSLLSKMEVSVWIRGYSPNHTFYGLKLDPREEMIMQREERKKEIKELFPQSDLKCKHCGKTDVSFSFAQLRSIDEPPTEFYTCNSCGKIDKK